MKKYLAVSLMTVLVSAAIVPVAIAQEASSPETAQESSTEPPAAAPQVVLETSMGSITVELFPDKAPATVKNFLNYVEKGFYNGTVFHRVIPGFMIQGGGFNADMTKKKTDGPLLNEARPDVKNERGTLAMARTNDPHSATAQFFINSVDNEFLNHTSKTGRGWGYAVFARVIEGMEVVDAISKVPTGVKNRMRDVPQEPVTINKATVKK